MDFRYKITLYPLYIIIPGLLILSYLTNYGYLPNIQIFFVEHVVDIGTFAFVIELVGFLLLILGKKPDLFHTMSNSRIGGGPKPNAKDTMKQLFIWKVGGLLIMLGIILQYGIFRL